MNVIYHARHLPAYTLRCAKHAAAFPFRHPVVTTATALELLVAGCASSQYTAQNVHGLSDRERQVLQDQAQADVGNQWDAPTLSPYQRAKQLESILGHFPQHAFDFYTVQQQRLARGEVDLTSHGNASMDEVGLMLGAIPSHSHYSHLRLSRPSRDLLFAGSSENQLTINSGLLRVANYSTDPDMRFYTVEVVETTRVNRNLNDARTFRHTITFPTTEAEASKYRWDFVNVLKVLEDTALYGALGGEWAAIGKVTSAGIQFTASGIEGRMRVPAGTQLMGGRDTVGGLGGPPADTYRELQHARDMDTSSLFVIPYTIQTDQGPVDGAAVVHAQRVRSARWDPEHNALQICTEIEGTNHFADFLARNLDAIALIAADGVCRHDDDETIVRKVEECQPPGRIGGGPTKGGGQTGGGGASRGGGSPSR